MSRLNVIRLISRERATSYPVLETIWRPRVTSVLIERTA